MRACLTLNLSAGESENGSAPVPPDDDEGASAAMALAATGRGDAGAVLGARARPTRLQPQAGAVDERSPAAAPCSNSRANVPRPACCCKETGQQGWHRGVTLSGIKDAGGCGVDTTGVELARMPGAPPPLLPQQGRR